MPQKVIEFPSKDDESNVAQMFSDHPTMLIIGDPKDLLDPDKKVIRRKLIVIVIDYPLDEAEVNVTVRCPKGLTRIQLFKEIAKAYLDIYRAPKKNRVYGHDIDDLWLEGAKLHGPWLKLFIGS